MTRHYRWQTLLGAKALFALLFVHLPFFAANAAVLAAHGFQPFKYLPALLWKQVLVAAFLTIPALAVASLCRNITQSFLAALILFGGAAYLEGIFNPLRMP